MANISPAGRLLKQIFIYPLQAIFIYGFVYFMRLLPINVAADIGSLLARILGPFTREQKIARQNLKHAYPKKTENELNEILTGMWDNLGRVVGEWPQLDLIDTVGPKSNVEVIGVEILLNAHKSGKSFIVFSAHMANWEIGLLVLAQRSVQASGIYRSASNPWVDKLIAKFRTNICSELIPKGKKGGKSILKVLQENRPLALLVDQKLNTGLPVPFFGRDAMTAPTPAELALRLNCSLIPTKLERLPKGKFRVTFIPPMELPDTGNRKQDVHRLLCQINGLLESWIRERPEQWFWVHKRWPN